MRALVFSLLPTLLFAGCAFEPGSPFAELSPEVDVRWQVPDERVRPGGFALLSSGYEVRLTRAELTVERAALRSLSGGGGGGGGAFDPASPPPGYSLCHNGHCHRDADGALIPYAQIEAELAGGGQVTAVEVVRLPVSSAVDLLEGLAVTPSCEPSCDLEAVRLTDAQVVLSAVRFEGVVRDTLNPPRIVGEQAFSFAVDAAVAQTNLDVSTSREEDPALSVRLLLHPSPLLFDAVDWAADPTLMEVESIESIETRLSTRALEVEVERGR